MPTERRKKEKELRKEIILAAAEKVFGARPYDDVSVLQISRAADVCIQSIYNLFGSKEKLYRSMIFFRIDRFHSELDRVLATAEGPLDALKKWTRTFFGSMAEYPEFFPVLLRERFHYEWGIRSKVPALEVRDSFTREEARLESLLRNAQAGGVLRDMPVELLRSVFFGFVEAKLEYHFKVKKCLEVDECVEETFSYFLDGCGA